MSNYFVSVIIPVYNAEKTLERAFNSVKNQTIGFENIELLLCDDCSTDNSFSIMQKWAKQYSNVKVFKTPKNTGSASEPRNVCLNNASAPFIMFLDNDDLFDIRACEILYSEINGTDLDIVGGCYSELHGKRVTDVSERYAALSEKDYDISKSFEVLFPATDPFWTKIFKRSLISENNLSFKQVYGEDSLFIASYLACCNKARHIKKNIYIYCIREDSLYHDFSGKHLAEVTKCYTLMEDYLAKKKKSGYFVRFLELGISGYMDILANADYLSDEEAAEVLKEWWRLILKGAELKTAPQNEIGAVLLDDAEDKAYDKAVFHLNLFRKLYAQRKREMNEIYSSRGWRILTFVNRLLGR